MKTEMPRNACWMAVLQSRRSAIVCAAVIGVWILFVVGDFFHDDAFITLRYAENILAGNGAVWNPGEYVQGYTNFLLLIIVSLLGALGIDLMVAARIVGLLSLVALVGVLWYFRSTAESQRTGDALSIAMVVVLTSAPLLVWSVGGLETVLFSCLVTAGCLSLRYSGGNFEDQKRCLNAGLLLGFAYLTRPDGIVFVAVTGLWFLSAASRDQAVYRSMIRFAVGFSAIVLPYILWQLFYYADVVPNTFYAKAGVPAPQKFLYGLTYIKAFALAPPYLPILLFLGLIAVLMKGAWNRNLSFLLSMVYGYLLFILYAGGDHMQSFRFLAPIIPLMGVLLGEAITSITEHSGEAILPASMLILALSAAQLLYPDITPRQKDAAALVGAAIGHHIEQAWPAGSLVALHTAGSTPYFGASHRYIDMLGLNDVHIGRRKITEFQLTSQRVPGHSKGDGVYVLQRAPDFIIAGPADGSPVEEPWFLSDLELARNPEFRRDYELVREPVPVSLASVGRELVLTYYRRVAR